MSSEEDKFAILRTPAIRCEIPSEAAKQLMQQWNIPKELMEGGDNNYAQAKQHEQAWLRRWGR